MKLFKSAVPFPSILVLALVGIAAFNSTKSGQAAPTTSPVFDLVRVEDSPGGSVDVFLSTREMLRASGAKVEIKGYCASACTLFLDLPDVCVFPGARLGFHLPYWARGDVAGVRLYEAEKQKQEFLKLYPKPIRDWITAKGGLGVDMIWLEGKELAALVPSCTADIPAV